MIASLPQLLHAPGVVIYLKTRWVISVKNQPSKCVTSMEGYSHIMYFCKQVELLLLTFIVVNNDGIPGEGFTQFRRDKLDAGGKKNFDYDWFSIYPPSPREFEVAWDAYKKADPYIAQTKPGRSLIICRMRRNFLARG